MTNQTQRTPTRVMCVTVDIEGWSKRLVPEQLKAQEVLITVLDEACRRAHLDRELWERQGSGDGEVALLPSGIDETSAIAELILGTATALRQANRSLNDANRVRLRMAFGSGLVFYGVNGFAGAVVIETCRLLDSPPVREALTHYPRADLAVIVSEHLYREIIVHDFHALRSEEFWQATAKIDSKGFNQDAWVYVSDRDGGPEPQGEREVIVPVPRPPVPAGVGTPLSGEEITGLLDRWRHRNAAGDAPSPDDTLASADRSRAAGEFRKGARGYADVLEADPENVTAQLGLARTLLDGGRHAWEAMPLLDAVLARSDVPDGIRVEALYVRAGAYVMLGDQRRAVTDLEALIGRVPDLAEPPAPAAMLLLGQCHLELGAPKAAIQVWSFLLDRRPFEPEAYLRIGRLEYGQESYGAARAHLNEGLRVLRAQPAAVADPDAMARDLLLALSDVSTATGDDVEADRLLNQAANADPNDPAALVTLAYRVATRDDRSAAYRLLMTALARVPATQRLAFGTGEVSRAIASPGGEVILDLLRAEGCVEQAAYDHAMAVRTQSRRDIE